MGILVSLCVLFGSTIELADGEMFEGKVIAQSDRKIWLQLDGGGVLTFDRAKVAAIDGKPLERAPEPESTDAEPGDGLPSSVPVQGDPRPDAPGVSGPDAAGETHPKPRSEEPPDVTPEPGPDALPEIAPQRPPAEPPLFKGKELRLVIPSGRPLAGREIRLTCPESFRREARDLRPPEVAVIVEEGSEVCVSVQASPCEGSLEEALRKISSEIGAYVLLERSVRVRQSTGRFLEWQKSEDLQVRSNLTLILLEGGILYRVTATAPKSLFHAYRGIFRQILTSVSSGPGQVQSERVLPRPEAR